MIELSQFNHSKRLRENTKYISVILNPQDLFYYNVDVSANTHENTNPVQCSVSSESECFLLPVVSHSPDKSEPFIRIDSKIALVTKENIF